MKSCSCYAVLCVLEFVTLCSVRLYYVLYIAWSCIPYCVNLYFPHYIYHAKLFFQQLLNYQPYWFGQSCFPLHFQAKRAGVNQDVQHTFAEVGSGGYNYIYGVNPNPTEPTYIQYLRKSHYGHRWLGADMALSHL